jgi:hypothetical protein
MTEQQTGLRRLLNRVFGGPSQQLVELEKATEHARTTAQIMNYHADVLERRAREITAIAKRLRSTGRQRRAMGLGNGHSDVDH